MGAENSNVKGGWSGGALVLKDSQDNTILTINPSSGGFSFANGITVSGNAVIATQKVLTVTTAATLTLSDVGKEVRCSVDGTFITLPVGTTAVIAGASYTVRNTATSGGAQIILITSTTNAIIGAGVSSGGTNLLSNTKATQVYGDMVSVQYTGSTTWYVVGMTGTWASTT